MKEASGSPTMEESLEDNLAGVNTYQEPQVDNLAGVTTYQEPQVDNLIGESVTGFSIKFIGDWTVLQIMSGDLG